MKKAIEKYVDFNDLDKVIEKNKNGYSLKNGSEKFIKIILPVDPTGVECRRFPLFIPHTTAAAVPS